MFMAVYNVTESKTKTVGTSAIDSIYNFESYSTINAGKGNDVISLSPSSSHNVIEYATGDGNDRIYGFDPTDVFNITSGVLTSSVKSYFNNRHWKNYTRGSRVKIYQRNQFANGFKRKNSTHNEQI